VQQGVAREACQVNLLFSINYECVLVSGVHPLINLGYRPVHVADAEMVLVSFEDLPVESGIGQTGSALGKLGPDDYHSETFVYLEVIPNPAVFDRVEEAEGQPIPRPHQTRKNRRGFPDFMDQKGMHMPAAQYPCK